VHTVCVKNSKSWLALLLLLLLMLLQYSDVMRLQVKVDEHYSYQDVASVMAITDCYSTAEPHVDAVCDVYIQKIGPHYRAYVYVNPVIALSRHGH